MNTNKILSPFLSSSIFAAVCAVVAMTACTSSYAAFCVNGLAFTKPTEISSSKRANSTHTMSDGKFAATSVARELGITKLTQEMLNMVLGIKQHGDTPPMEFVPAEGAQATYLTRADGDSGIVTRIQVKNAHLNAQGEAVLEGTLLLPASGHTGEASARKYAVSDTYTIRLQTSVDANGKQYPSSYGDSGKALIQDAKSLDLVTSHEMAIPLVAGKVVAIYYFRSGSGGPAGYFDGRVIEFVWDGSVAQ